MRRLVNLGCIGVALAMLMPMALNSAAARHQRAHAAHSFGYCQTLLKQMPSTLPQMMASISSNRSILASLFLIANETPQGSWTSNDFAQLFGSTAADVMTNHFGISKIVRSGDHIDVYMKNLSDHDNQGSIEISSHTAFDVASDSTHGGGTAVRNLTGVHAGSWPFDAQVIGFDEWALSGGMIYATMLIDPTIPLQHSENLCVYPDGDIQKQ